MKCPRLLLEDELAGGGDRGLGTGALGLVDAGAVEHLGEVHDARAHAGVEVGLSALEVVLDEVAEGLDALDSLGAHVVSAVHLLQREGHEAQVRGRSRLDAEGLKLRLGLGREGDSGRTLDLAAQRRVCELGQEDLADNLVGLVDEGELEADEDAVGAGHEVHRRVGAEVELEGRERARGAGVDGGEEVLEHAAEGNALEGGEELDGGLLLALPVSLLDLWASRGKSGQVRRVRVRIKDRYR